MNKSNTLALRKIWVRGENKCKRALQLQLQLQVWGTGPELCRPAVNAQLASFLGPSRHASVLTKLTGLWLLWLDRFSDLRRVGSNAPSPQQEEICHQGSPPFRQLADWRPWFLPVLQTGVWACLYLFSKPAFYSWRQVPCPTSSLLGWNGEATTCGPEIETPRKKRVRPGRENTLSDTHLFCVYLMLGQLRSGNATFPLSTVSHVSSLCLCLRRRHTHGAVRYLCCRGLVSSCPAQSSQCAAIISGSLVNINRQTVS